MKLKDLKDKKILILGFGIEGEDSYWAIRKLFPKKPIAIADKKPLKEFPTDVIDVLQLDDNLKLFFGKNYLKNIEKYDVIIKTPGMPESVLKPLKNKESIITSQTKIFFDNCPASQIIGITGTKGKGTTTSLIHHILKQAGKKSHLVGNIGEPVFQKLLKIKPNDIFVYELSSHQLQGLKKSPHIAVFLNLFPDHLEYYKDFAEYKKAKENIFLHQTKNDFLIKNLKISDKKEIPTKKIPLKGEFNLLNILAAIKVAKLLNIDKKIIKRAIETFKGLPHRLEYIGRYKGIDFYDDSMSTIPEVAIAALKALPKTETILVGGSEKGSDYKEMAKAIEKSKIKTIIVLGKEGTGKKIVENSKKKIIWVESMKDAVKAAYANTNKGRICLMSPGSASFNLFKNYKERGDLFKKYVNYYAK